MYHIAINRVLEAIPAFAECGATEGPQSIVVTDDDKRGSVVSGKAMVAYTKLQQWKKQESERLGEEEDQIKFIHFRFERWQVVGFEKGRRR